MWTFVPPIPTELSKHGQTVGQTKLCRKSDVFTQIQKRQLGINQRSSLAKFIVTLFIKYNRDAHWCVSSPQNGSVEQSTKNKYVLLPRQDGITLPRKILLARFSHDKLKQITNQNVSVICHLITVFKIVYSH